MKKNNLVTTILCMALFLICNNCRAQNVNTTDLTSVRKAIEKTNMLYYNLFAKKDIAIVNLYTEDGILSPPNAPQKIGKKDLIKDFSETFADGTVKGVKFHTKDIYGDGKDYVTEEGTWQVFDPKGKLIDDGKYLKLWKKTKDGWKIFRDLFNSNNKTQQ